MCYSFKYINIFFGYYNIRAIVFRQIVFGWYHWGESVFGSMDSGERARIFKFNAWLRQIFYTSTQIIERTSQTDNVDTLTEYYNSQIDDLDR